MPFLSQEGNKVKSINLVIPGEPMEEWKDVKGWKGFYQISNLGQVKSLARKITHKNGLITSVSEKILNPVKDGKGYLMVRFSLCHKSTMMKVHRLVALHFINNQEDKPQVNHIDGNKEHNQYFNLEWCTCLENSQHAFKNGLMQRGESRSDAKLSNDQILEIRTIYIKGDKCFGAKPLARKYGVSGMHIRNVINNIKRRTG